MYGYGCAEIVRRLIQNPLHSILATAALFMLWQTLRRKRRSHWGYEPYSFADDGDPAVQVTNFAPE
jgi:hypothetical protein